MTIKTGGTDFLHIAQIGVDMVGRPTAYTVLCSNIADELTVCDIKPGLATAFAEKLKHVTSSIKSDAKIFSCQKGREVKAAQSIYEKNKTIQIKK